MLQEDYKWEDYVYSTLININQSQRVITPFAKAYLRRSKRGYEGGVWARNMKYNPEQYILEYEAIDVTQLEVQGAGLNPQFNNVNNNPLENEINRLKVFYYIL